MSEAWTDEVLLRRLAAALEAAEAVPRDFVEAGRTAYAWHGIDTDLAELAELAYDSDLHEDRLALTRADPAVLRAMTYISAELTIEIEVTEDALYGQVVPPQPGAVHVCVRSGARSEIAVDDVGCFLVHAKPEGVPVGPNEIDLVRVYVTETNQQSADETPLAASGTTFDVIVEAEAGNTRVDGAPFEVSVLARDSSSGTDPAGFGTFTQSDKGTLSGPQWPRYRKRFQVTISDSAAVDGHVMEYVAVLKAAEGANRVTKFATSPLFILQR